MMKGESPSASTGPATLGLTRKLRARKRRLERLEEMNRSTHTAETVWERMVASAAPRTPISSAKMKMGSRTMLSAAPMQTVSMAVLAKPCAETNWFIPSAICTLIVPIR